MMHIEDRMNWDFLRFWYVYVPISNQILFILKHQEGRIIFFVVFCSFYNMFRISSGQVDAFCTNGKQNNQYKSHDWCFFSRCFLTEGLTEIYNIRRKESLANFQNLFTVYFLLVDNTRLTLYCLFFVDYRIYNVL